MEKKTAEILIDGGAIKLDEVQSSDLLSCLCRMVDAGCESSTQDGDIHCHFCQAWIEYNEPHADDCVWVKSRKLVMEILTR